MSRIGSKPVTVPSGVKAEIAGQLLKVEGPKGKLQRELRKEIAISLEDSQLVFTRRSDEKASRAFHGMERALVNNMVVGVSEGYVKELCLLGVSIPVTMKPFTF